MLADDALFAAVDDWLTRQPEESFVELLPLLRRSFVSFGATTRRGLLERVRHAGRASEAVAVDDPRAAAAFARRAAYESDSRSDRRSMSAYAAGAALPQPSGGKQTSPFNDASITLGEYPASSHRFSSPRMRGTFSDAR